MYTAILESATRQHHPLPAATAQQLRGNAADAATTSPDIEGILQVMNPVRGTVALLTDRDLRHLAPTLGLPTSTEELNSAAGFDLNMLPDQERQRDTITIWRNMLDTQLVTMDPQAWTTVANHLQQTDREGDAAITSYIATHIATHFTLPDPRQLLTDTIRHTHLWNSWIGDYQIDALAILLNLAITIHQPNRPPLFPLNPNSPNQLHIYRDGDHYWALQPTNPQDR
jgi:hypothetical protein